MIELTVSIVSYKLLKQVDSGVLLLFSRVIGVVDSTSVAILLFSMSAAGVCCPFSS